MQSSSQPGPSNMRTNLFILFSFVLAGCTSSTSPQQSIEAACEALVLDYAYYRDREDLQLAAEGVSSVFTEDATLTVNGERFQGRGAIFDRIADQANPPLIAHMMSTIRIFPQSASQATGISYVTVYVAPRPKDGTASAEGFAALGEYHDEFTLTPQGWRIAKRTFFTRIRYQRDPA